MKNKIHNTEIKHEWPHLKDVNLDFSSTREI